MKKEKTIRSIVKSISYRLTGTLVTVGVSFIIIGEITFALKIGAVELFAKMFTYYLHERVWNRLKFGLEEVQPPEYNI